MAEKVLYNVAGGILGSLAGPLVAEEIRLLLGADGELERFTDTVSTIRAVLLDAEERQFQSHAVSHWLERLSDVLYEADDLLDAVSTEVRRREIMTHDKKAKEVRIFFSKSNQLAFRLKMGHKIKAIRERLDAIKADRDFHLEERIEKTPVMVTGRDDTSSFVLKQHVIGREDDTEKVIRSLLDSNTEKSLSILPIVGIGGLGKTTLAQLVFNDERMENFDLKMWVCVSDNFNVRNIVEKILKSAKEEHEGDEMAQLVDCLQKKIVSKNFFLVLDDVWNENREKWFKLKNLLTNDVVGSKILITTRSDEVARITHTIKPYILRGLGKEESWDLFKKMAFDGEEPKNSNIKEIGEEIVRKCGGVPLALGAMGCMLFGEDSVKEWLAFKDNQLSKISETTILSTLKLSYDVLPSHLKHCFVYCSLFPKDYEFNEAMLIRLWIAQEFVKLEENRLLEDIGHNYFMRLVSRLFFQNYGNTFKLHDLMHDLTRQLAGSSIITTIDANKDVDTKKIRHMLVSGENSSSFQASKTRTFICFEGKMNFEKIISNFKLLRVLILENSNLKGVPRNISKLKHLRYLDFSRNQEIKQLPDSITRLINLQTLILFGCSLEKLPRDIKKLVNLRYLDFSFNEKIKQLPDSITRLINLQTLILSGCSLEKLPRDIKKLVNLRHLDISYCNLRFIPRGIGQLTNLQYLTLFVVGSHPPSEHNAGFEELSELKILRGQLELRDWSSGITAKASESSDVDSNLKSAFNILELKNLSDGDISPQDCSDDDTSSQGFPMCSNLNDLRLRNYQSSGGPLNYLSSLTSLVQLKVEFVKRCKYLPSLCQLPSLEKVYLDELDDLEYISGYVDGSQLCFSTVPVTCFPSLKFLQISSCPNLKGWLWDNSRIEAEANNHCDISVMGQDLLPMFACLSRLIIIGCPLLTSMPIFPNITDQLRLIGSNLKPLQQTSQLRSTGSSLTPLSKLKHLELLSAFGLETLPIEGLHYLTSLEYLEISHLDKFKSLSLKHLTALKHLCFYYCLELEHTNDEDGIQWKGLKSLLSISFIKLPKLASLASELQHITTLQKLCIEDCESLTIIPKCICDNKGLEELEIVRCSRLKSIPERVFGLTSLKSLVIMDCPIELQSCEGKTDLEPTNDVDELQGQDLKSSLSVHLKKLSDLVSLALWLQYATTLQKLCVEDCESLTNIPECLCNNKGLEKLEIVRCSRLISISERVFGLTSLQSLVIVDCPIRFQSCEGKIDLELTNNVEGFQGQGSFLFVHLKELPNLVSLPLGLQCATTLRELCIEHCESLTTIPEWICGHESLEKLQVIGCSKLTSIPEGLDSLTSLKSLLFVYYPINLQSRGGEIDAEPESSDRTL